MKLAQIQICGCSTKQSYSVKLIFVSTKTAYSNSWFVEVPSDTASYSIDSAPLYAPNWGFNEENLRQVNDFLVGTNLMLLGSAFSCQSTRYQLCSRKPISVTRSFCLPVVSSHFSERYSRRVFIIVRTKNCKIAVADGSVVSDLRTSVLTMVWT